MNQYSENEKLNLFKSLFKGREDVFAIRWEKAKKSGYMPAYHYDPYIYRLHKMKGGTFKDYKDKTYLPLTDQQFLKHFNGEQYIGVYPLLQDNTSWFIAADFDKAEWADECSTGTLDTEEATYIWHVDKNKRLLWQKLRSIDQDLNVIRNKGRQTFLKKKPENFSRLIHDYSDERKGFVIWKDHLEERLL